ncbi:MAG: hypothetical protein ACRDIB_08900 [Ardenticatenaceae bacterium]
MEEGIATISSTSGELRQAAIRQQLMKSDLTNKDADTAFILELVGGIFGLLGIGYLYAGLTNAGVVRLIGYWIGLTIMWSVFWVFATATFGLGACFCFAPLAVQFIIPFFSANDLKQSMEDVKRDRAGDSARLGNYARAEPGSSSNAMYELEQDLFPGIERELEQERLDKARRAAEFRKGRQSETPVHPEDEAEYGNRDNA